MAVYLTSTKTGPVTRLLASVLGAAMLVGAFMLGLVFLAVVLGIALVLGLAAWLRAWWLQRKVAGHPNAQTTSSERPNSGVIDAEYTVISRERVKR